MSGGVPVERYFVPSVRAQLIFHALFIPALFLIWEGLVRAGVLKAAIVGRPLLMLEQLWEILTTRGTLDAVQVTLTEVVLGLVLGAACGIAVAIVLSFFPFLRRGLDTLFLALYTLPRVALVPLFIVWFGLGMASKVSAVFIHGFVLFLLGTYATVESVDRALLRNFRMLCAPKLRYLTEIYAPWAVPNFFVVLRQAVGLAIGTAVVAELIGSFEGVGYEIGLRIGAFDMNGTLAWVLIVATLAVLLDRIASYFEKRLLVWR
jgi:NitT/TauT family transport system permease protein